MQIQPPVSSLKDFSRGTAQVAPPQIFGKTPQGERRMVPVLLDFYEVL